MDRIIFGSDGWKGIIAKDFTIASVSKVVYATSLWLSRKYKNPSVVVGYDCRFGGEMFMEAVVKILASKGIRVFIPEQFVSSPMLALSVKKLKANCGIMISACNAPVNYNGYRLIGNHGGCMFEKDVKDIENLISEDNEVDLELLNWNSLLEQSLIHYINLETIYIKEIKDTFAVDEINKSGIRFIVDVMYGSGQNIINKLLPDCTVIHNEVNPAFKGIPPDPVYKNLHELDELMTKNKNMAFGLAMDGDADRIALFDAQGNFIDANLLLLLLIHYLAGYKQMKGKIVASFSSTEKVAAICAHYGLELIQSKIGFREIAKIMTEDNVLVAGEESGRVAFGRYLPQCDAIWTGFLICQALIDTGKSLKELIDEVYSITGTFGYEKVEIELNRIQRNKVIENCKNKIYKSFGEYQVERYVTLDGYKYYLGENRWLLIRATETEHIISLYAEAENINIARDIINKALQVLEKSD
jgi:phosphomannomutase